MLQRVGLVLVTFLVIGTIFTALFVILKDNESDSAATSRSSILVTVTPESANLRPTLTVSPTATLEPRSTPLIATSLITTPQSARIDDPIAPVVVPEIVAPRARESGNPPPELVMPEQFQIEAVSALGAFDRPTAFVLGERGQIYVANANGIELAADSTGDGHFDRVTHFALDSPWVLGLAYLGGNLYAADGGRLLRLRDGNGDTVADVHQVLIAGLPTNLYGGHSNNGLAFGPDGRLFMTVGGTSDHGPELVANAGVILAMDLETGALTSYASGFRNPYDLTFCPSGQLFASENGPDGLDDTLIFRPPDEVNLVLEGRNYGYPDFFGYAPFWADVESPIALLPVSGAATGIVCYSGTGFPDVFQNSLFVTLWGTLTFEIETGRRLMNVRLEEINGRVFGVLSEFATGFEHPIDVIQDRDGSLLVLDYGLGQIFRISYIGGN